MGKTFSDTLPRPGDRDNILLGKILQRLNGSPDFGDTDNNLLRKILLQLNGMVDPSDLQNEILQKILNQLSGSGEALLTGDPSANLEQIGLQVYAPTGMTSVVWNAENSESGFYWTNDPDIVSFSAPRLVTCITTNDGYFSFVDNSSLASLSFPLLTTVGQIELTSLPALTSISFPSLVSAFATVAIHTNANLTSISFPNFVPTDVDSNNISMPGCALDAASVNHILAVYLASGVTSRTITLSGGTNAAPTGQGIADKAALILAGNTVVTN